MTSEAEIGRAEHGPLTERLMDIMLPEGGPKACQVLSELSSLAEEEDEEK